MICLLAGYSWNRTLFEEYNYKIVAHLLNLSGSQEVEFHEIEIQLFQEVEILLFHEIETYNNIDQEDDTSIMRSKLPNNAF